MPFNTQNISTSSVENRNSRLVQGGTTDIYNNRLGWWEKRTLPQQENDFLLVVLEHEAGRPDLISNRVYGKATFAWLVLQYNSIVDPVTELVAGVAIRLPTQSRLILDIITKSEGGNNVV